MYIQTRTPNTKLSKTQTRKRRNNYKTRQTVGRLTRGGGGSRVYEHEEQIIQARAPDSYTELYVLYENLFVSQNLSNTEIFLPSPRASRSWTPQLPAFFLSSASPPPKAQPFPLFCLIPLSSRSVCFHLFCSTRKLHRLAFLFLSHTSILYYTKFLKLSLELYMEGGICIEKERAGVHG